MSAIAAVKATAHLSAYEYSEESLEVKEEPARRALSFRMEGYFGSVRFQASTASASLRATSGCRVARLVFSAGSLGTS
jgi:hypothetical protein